MTFNASKRGVMGGKANELFATLATAGVTPEGAAGSNFENISKLNCTVDPNEIRRKSGGGADCSFETAK